MRKLSHLLRIAGCAAMFLCLFPCKTKANDLPLRIMSANLNGNVQSYQPFALRIFQGLKPDVVAIQEFNYSNNTAADFQSMIDSAFGTNFSYFRESGNYSIPNGIISRYPITSAGSWDDPDVPDRGFAWAQISLPGSNPLYVVSVHLNGSGGSAVRNTEATNLKALIQNNFSNSWVIVAGDFNTDTRTETCISTFTTFLSDKPIPSDAEVNGDQDTNEPRSKPYDYVLPSFSFTNFLTSSVFPSHSFSNGLVFDSRVYNPLSDVSPVQTFDSTNAQHMAVIKDFLIPGINNNSNPPAIVSPPQDATAHIGTDARFSVSATGSAPLTFEWRFAGATIPGATGSSYTRSNVQPADAGSYLAVITNSYGSVTSSPAVLTVSTAPYILAEPNPQTVTAGQNASFSVAANGAALLAYQWQFNGSDIFGATTSSYTKINAQNADQGNYSVIITNSAGSTSSAPAFLTVNVVGQNSAIAQWNFSNTNGSTTSPAPSTGSGLASLVGGTIPASPVWATGSSTDPNPTNSGWNTTSYPSQGTGNKTAGVQFKVSTLGWQNLVIRWDMRASNTGSKYSRLQYTTNGTTFIDFPTATSLSGTAFESKTNSLASTPGVNNNPNFAFRIVAEFESTAVNNTNANYAASTSYGTGGTLRFDMVTISGIPVTPAGAAPALLSQPGISNQQFSFNLVGSPGSNYIIQVATNLNSANWIPLLTNISPFVYSETNGFPARFYRAVSSP